MALWDGHEDGGPVADAACWSIFAVTALVVMLRLYSRAGFGSNDLGLDDYITVFCLVVTLVTCILVSIGSSWGLGKHAATLSPHELVMAAKYNVVVSAVLIWVFSLPKFAIVALLRRILNFGTKTAVLFWTLAITSQACVLATSIWWFEQCTPVEHGWNPAVPGKCSSLSILADLGYFTSAYSAFLDLFFAFYPVPLVMQLNMARRKRIAVCIALSLSSLAFSLSVYKLTIFPSVFEELAVDPTFPVPYLDILGLAEGCILIICTSLPALGPVYRGCKAKIFTHHGSSRNSQQYNSAAHRSGSNPFPNSWRRGGRGHKLDDLEQTIDVSTDNIPLSPTAYQHELRSVESGDIQKSVEIQKTVEISVAHEGKPEYDNRRPSNETT